MVTSLWMSQAHQLGGLGCDHVWVLDQRLERVVLGKRHNLQHLADPRENLPERERGVRSSETRGELELFAAAYDEKGPDMLEEVMQTFLRVFRFTNPVFFISRAR